MAFGDKRQKDDGGSTESEESGRRVTGDEGAEDGGRGRLFKFGSQNSAFEATDYSDTYANAKGYYLKFKHLPSGLTLKFKGFLTNLQDSFSSNWTPQSVYGRMDNIYTFQNTTRQISVGFVIPAFDAEDARCNLSKVTNLAKKLYPYYSDGAGNNSSSISRAPLMRVEFVNLIRDGRGQSGGLLGKVNGFTFTPNLEDGFFDYQNFLYPKTIEVSFTFDVLHEHIMGWTDDVDEDGNKNGLEWAEGTAPAFPYALQTKEQRAQADVGAPTDEDAEADTSTSLGNTTS